MFMFQTLTKYHSFKQFVIWNISQKKKKNRRDLTEEERRLVLETCGESKRNFMKECFSNSAPVGQLINHTIFIEVTIMCLSTILSS